MSPVADTILEQLGGARVFAMAFDQARSSYGPNMITLRIASGLVARIPGMKERATHLIIRLEAGDTYTVEVHRSTHAIGMVLGYYEGVHADQLRALVEDRTGLRLSL